MWHFFPLQVNSLDRKRIFEELRFRNIGVQVNYLPAHLHPVFVDLGYRRGQFPVSEQFYGQEISLPLHTELGDSAVEMIVDTVKEVI